MPQHVGLTIEKWQSISFMNRLANIGSEVHRALNWQEKGNHEYAGLAFLRSLELFDLTMQTNQSYPETKELCRLREVWVDYFKYTNIYQTDAKFWRNYFNYITVRAQIYQ